MRYRVGDKVRVRSNLKANIRYGGQVFTRGMEIHCGKNVEITDALDSAYYIQEDNYGFSWTDEMFEPVEEMSAVEAIKLYAEKCSEGKCSECSLSGKGSCTKYIKEHPEEALEVIKQWKADHEKKPIETEFVEIVRVIEDTGDTKRCVYEEDVTGVKDETFKMTMKRILEEYCKEHEGKFFTVYEEICRVKE